MARSADAAADDPLAEGAYAESVPEPSEAAPAPLALADVEHALGLLDGSYERKAVREEAAGSWTLAGPRQPSGGSASSARGGILQLRRVPCLRGLWNQGGILEPVPSYGDLRRRVESWEGTVPEAGSRIRAERAARAGAEWAVREEAARAAERPQAALERLIEAARLRLLRELGRYLVRLGEGTTDLNLLLHRQRMRDTASRDRLSRCLERLGGFPQWPPDLLESLEGFAGRVSENERGGRLRGQR